jgi:hypothetical protein
MPDDSQALIAHSQGQPIDTIWRVFELKSDFSDWLVNNLIRPVSARSA